MKELLLIIIILCSLKIVNSQNFDTYQYIKKVQDDYSINLLETRKYIGTPKYQSIADSITNILDSIGYYQYQIEFKNKEAIFWKEYQKLLSFNPQNTDSTFKILYNLSNASNYFFYFVKKHSKEIIPYCFDYKNNLVHREMLSMLNITKELKDSLLTYDNKWFLWQRISLGDTIIENDIISKFKDAVSNIKKFDDIYIIIDLGSILLASGSLKSLKAYISVFDCNKVVEKTKGVYITSLLNHLITDHHIFFNYYPQYYVLSFSYFISHSDDWNKRCLGIMMNEYEKSYVKQIEKFCLEEFDIELHINLPFFRMYDYEQYYTENDIKHWLMMYNIIFNPSSK